MSFQNDLYSQNEFPYDFKKLGRWMFSSSLSDFHSVPSSLTDIGLDIAIGCILIESAKLFIESEAQRFMTF